MSRHITSSVLFLLLSVFVAIAGCSEDAEYVTIEGVLEVDMGSTRSGFDFTSPTILIASDEGVDPNCAVGTCALHFDGEGGTSLDLALGRSVSGEGELGLDAFDLTIAQGEAGVRAQVVTPDGQVDYTGNHASCVIIEFDAEPGGDAYLEIDCSLEAEGAGPAVAFAQLSLSGCSVD